VTSILTAAFFYFHLAGQSVDPAIVAGVYAIWLAFGIWVLVRRPRASVAVLIILLWALTIGILVPWGLRRLITVTGYILTYNAFKIHQLNIAAAALSNAAILMSGLVIVGVYLGNPNVVAAFVYLAGMAGLGLSGWQRWVTLGMSAAALLATGSRGAWLAAGVAAVIYAGQYLALAGAPLAAGALYWLRPESVADRVQVWAAALGDLSWLGHGLGAAAVYPSLAGGLFYHAHCLPLTVAVEAGAPGLLALGYGVWRLVPNLARSWQGAALAGLLAWSLIDEVIWFWGPGVIACWLVAEVMRDTNS
jgi:hypothetical protein